MSRETFEAPRIEGVDTQTWGDLDDREFKLAWLAFQAEIDDTRSLLRLEF